MNINLDIRYEPLARQGAKVTIELPSAKTTTGTIASVDTVVTPGKDGRNSTVKVLVEVDDQHAFDGLDQAPVQVNLVAEHRDNVLTVPVAALLALGDGGYGVQVVDGRSTRIVKVDVGLFADGKVEVRGDGLTDGTTVGMPS